MNEQWPSERQADKSKIYVDTSFKTAQDFLHLFNLFSPIQLKEFDDVVNWIGLQGGDLSELKQRTAQLAHELFQSDSDSHPLLMTLACAAALAHTPSLQTWCNYNAFRYNSSQLGHWLSEAMLGYAEVHPQACTAYVELAKKVLAGLKSHSIQSTSDYTNNARAKLWANWSACQNKLEEIWRDLQEGHSFMNYEEELPLFYVLYKFDYDEFIETISRSDNPHLVSGLLFVAGIGAFSPRFSEWKRIISAAPVAFYEDGKWNGSVLIPLLLVDARNQLLRIRHNLQDPDITSNEIDKTKLEITSAIQLVVTTLTFRQDAPGIFSRWTPWLMRQILGHTEKEIADVKTTAFIDETLIEVIGRELENCPLPQTSPEDAPLWEAWCYRCVLASLAYSGFIKVPDWTSFRDEWKLTPEEWTGTKGDLLRGHASLIITFNKETPGVAANLLAYPLTQLTIGFETWSELWDAAVTLREIVEFGDSAIDDYSSRWEAGRLLLLLFQIGLAIFDQASAHTYDNNSPEARSLASLFKALNFATDEMLEIDITLNHDKWLLMTQHLTVRRMIWEGASCNENTSMGFQVFKADDTPNVSDIITRVKIDEPELIALLQSLILNSSDFGRLRAYLQLASIDLPKVMSSIKALNQYHPRKYPIDEAQLNKLNNHLTSP